MLPNPISCLRFVWSDVFCILHIGLLHCRRGGGLVKKCIGESEELSAWEREENWRVERLKSAPNHSPTTSPLDLHTLTPVIEHSRQFFQQNFIFGHFFTVSLTNAVISLQEKGLNLTMLRKFSRGKMHILAIFLYEVFLKKGRDEESKNVLLARPGALIVIVCYY